MSYFNQGGNDEGLDAQVFLNGMNSNLLCGMKCFQMDIPGGMVVRVRGVGAIIAASWVE